MPARSLSKGTVVEKINSAPGDSHQDGARGRVLSGPFGAGYLVEWNDAPRVRVFIVGAKLRAVKRQASGK